MKIRIEFDADIKTPEALRLAMYGLTYVHSGGRRKVIPDKTVLYVNSKRQSWWDIIEDKHEQRRKEQEERHQEWLRQRHNPIAKAVPKFE